jgi:acetyl-CoA carboxylase biotin carboxyl carrier protein
LFEETVEHRLRPIAAAFAESDLVRIRIADDTAEIELRRSSPGARAAVSGSGGEQTNRSFDVITSEVVGVVHFPRPAVEEGNALEGDRELAYVEALGIRNPVRSRGPGRIACVYVEEGQPVDYGQPLFAIDRS